MLTLFSMIDIRFFGHKCPPPMWKLFNENIKNDREKVELSKSATITNDFKQIIRINL